MTEMRRFKWWLVLIILACAGLYLIGNDRVPLWDRDEGWYAQCSKQMWETGDWVVPRFLGDLRTEKPVFVYWLQLGGYWLFGGPSEFAVRFYASVMQTIAVALVGVGFWRFAGPRRGIWSAFIYGTAALTIASAKMCLTDATMMVFLVLAQFCFMGMYLRGFSWLPLLIGSVSLGLGVLTKGPVALAPTALTAVALAVMDYKRWIGMVRPATGAFWNRVALGVFVALGVLAIIVAVPAPWLIVLEMREPAWIPGVLAIAKAHMTTTLEGHGGPPGYYLLLSLGTMFPWSLLFPLTVVVAWRQRRKAKTRFAIAAIVGPWIVFELMKTKLPHYPLPTFPFIAYLMADALVRCSRLKASMLYQRWVVIGIGIWAVLIGLAGLAPWLLIKAQPSLGKLPYVSMAVVSVLGLALTLGTWWLFYRRRPMVACAWMGGTFIVLLAVAYAWMIPQMKFLQTSTQLAEILEKCDGLADKARVGEVAMLVYSGPKGEGFGFREPTLPFYQGGTIREIDIDRYLETAPFEKWPRVLVITEPLYEILDEGVKQRLERVGTVRGYLYSDVRKIVDVSVFVKKQVGPTTAIIGP